MRLRDGWLDVDNARQLALTGWFGALIGNSDMHLGNLSLELHDRRPLPLAPVYDMLPMRWRPAATGEVTPPERAPQWRPPLPHETDDWLVAAKLALHFWQEAAATERISEDFRAIARSAEGALATAIQRVVFHPAICGALPTTESCRRPRAYDPTAPHP